MAKKEKPSKNGGEPPPKCPNGHAADSAGMCRIPGCPYNSLNTD